MNVSIKAKLAGTSYIVFYLQPPRWLSLLCFLPLKCWSGDYGSVRILIVNQLVATEVLQLLLVAV